MNSYFAKNTFLIFGVIGVELYGLSFAIVAYMLMIFMCLLDVSLGYYIARSRGIVTSKAGTDGLYSKAVWGLLIGGMIFFLGNMSYVVDNETIKVFLSLFVMVFIAYRLFFEFVSIIENQAVISSEKEKGALKRLVGVMMKIVGISQQTIDKKIEKYQA